MFTARPLSRTLLVVTLLALPLAAIGCYPDRSRPGVSAKQGVYERFYAADQATVYDAASDAMDVLGYVVTDRDRPAGATWTLRARDAGANLVTVRVDPGTLESARVAVTIDPGRNDSMSQLVLNVIGDQLR